MLSVDITVFWTSKDFLKKNNERRYSPIPDWNGVFCDRKGELSSCSHCNVPYKLHIIYYTLSELIYFKGGIFMGMPIITPGTITRGESAADIIESIANQESAIAHILNAESEKLQTVIDKPDATVQQLLAVNRSVKNTIDTIISLETALKSKLQMFQDTICQTN